MEIKIIYPDPLLRQQCEFADKINNKPNWEAQFEGKGNGEVIMIINKSGGKTNDIDN